MLCLDIQYNTLLSTTLHIFKHSGGCIMYPVSCVVYAEAEFIVAGDFNKANEKNAPEIL